METTSQISEFESEVLIDRHQFASKSSGDATVEQYSTSTIKLMTPKTKAVYMQYVKDSKDNLLVDGFFRENMPNELLPHPINRMIAAYYLKSHSLRKLKEMLQPIRMEIYVICNMFCSFKSLPITHFHSETTKRKQGQMQEGKGRK